MSADTKGSMAVPSSSSKAEEEIICNGNVPQNIPHRGDLDVAATFLANLSSAIAEEPIRPTEARKLLWKVDLIMIPLITATIILAAIDKVIISNAAIYGMMDDTNLADNQFSWVGSIFYFGFLIFEYPSGLLIQRFPVAKFLSAAVMGWAVLMLCTAATQNFAGLAVVRFIMGMLEAVTFPAASILTVMWWTTKEQPIRLAFWFNQ